MLVDPGSEVKNRKALRPQKIWEAVGPECVIDRR